jgi:hypothetical protein
MRTAQGTPGYTIPGLIASDAVARVEDALGELEKLADDLYTVSRLDPEDNLHRPGALERLEEAVRQALRAWREE